MQQAEQQNQSPRDLVRQAKERGYNVLVAADNLHCSTPAYKVDFATVHVNPDPASGDVFKVGSVNEDGKWVDRFTLARSSLERLSLAAGVFWHPLETKPLEITRDYVLYQAVGLVRSPSGEPVIIKGTKELDLTVIEEEIREEQAVKIRNEGNKNRRTWDRKVTYDDLTPEEQKKCDRAVRKEMVQIRKHKLARAETGAKNRAIRSMGIKSSYTAEELQRPFLVARIVPDPNHPAHRAFLQEMRKALFDSGPRFLDSPEEAQEVPYEEQDVDLPPLESAPVENGAVDTHRPVESAEAAKAGPPVEFSVEAQERAQNLRRYASQFGVDEAALGRYAATTFGVENLAEITPAQYRQARLWIQDQKAIAVE